MSSVATPQVMRLRETHRVLLLEHYRHLDKASRNCRFGYNVSENALASFVARLDFNKDVHFGIIQEQRLVAVAQISPVNPDYPNTLELGISVATSARKQGYALHLWRYLTTYAAQHHKEAIHVQYLAENKAMASFCAKRGLIPTQYGSERVSVWLNPEFNPETSYPSSHASIKTA